MRFLVTLSPLPSHLQPMLPSIRAAVSAGHEVVVATGPDLIRDLRRCRLTTWSVGRSARQAWVDLPLTRRPDRAGLTDPVSALYAQPAIARIAELLPRVAEWRPDVVMHDVLDLAGAEIAGQTGALQVGHGLGPHTDRWFPILPRITAEIARTLGQPDRYAATITAPYLDPTPPALGTPNQLFSDVRPLRPEVETTRAGQRLPLRVQRFDPQPTILLSLGPAVATAEPILTVLEGLRHVAVNVIVETGPQVEVGALGPLPERFAAARTVPLDTVLPLCSAVISDGSTMIDIASIAYGLPQIQLPRTEPDRETAIRLARRGAAIVLNPERLTPGAIRRALADVLHLPGYRAAARRLREEQRAVPSAAVVLERLALPIAA